MTTKTKAVKTKAVKTSKPAVKPYAATQGDINLAASIGLNMRQGESAKAAANKAVQELKAHGAVIGDARTCPLAQAFIDKRFPMGKGVNGKAVSKGSIANALNAFRAAVKSGKEYDENKGRAKAKAKGKTGAKAGGSIMLAFPSGITLDKAVATLEKGVEKMKESGNAALIQIAAYLVDCVEELKAE